MWLFYHTPERKILELGGWRRYGTNKVKGFARMVLRHCYIYTGSRKGFGDSNLLVVLRVYAPLVWTFALILRLVRDDLFVKYLTAAVPDMPGTYLRSRFAQVVLVVVICSIVQEGWRNRFYIVVPCN